MWDGVKGRSWAGELERRPSATDAAAPYRRCETLSYYTPGDLFDVRSSVSADLSSRVSKC